MMNAPNGLGLTLLPMLAINRLDGSFLLGVISTLFLRLGTQMPKALR